MKKQYDVIVVGTGAAGLYVALCLPITLDVLVITKDEMKKSDSYLAQGGIAVLRDETDFDAYFEDTMRAGRYKNNEDAVRVMIQESRNIIEELIGYGVEFDQDEEGNLSYTREGGHSIFRILHHKDETGKEITSKLLATALKRSNITIQEYVTMLDIIEENKACKGIIAEKKDGTIEAIFAKEIILATGGIGGLFTQSTNFRHIAGDSFAISLKHHIALKDINYIQIHPTTLYSKKKGRRFLISESVRGEGAVLLNEDKERFVDELLPRDVVTDAIKSEMKKYHSDYVYLSMQGMTKKAAMQRFPSIYKKCSEEGYDLSKDLIPVTPAQHYLMGGMEVNRNGATSMQHLYAVGETACNGVHGANRLASNSLLESLVFSKCAAKNIENEIAGIHIKPCAVDLQRYQNVQKIKAQDQALVKNEIKRKGREFYDNWCN